MGKTAGDAPLADRIRQAAGSTDVRVTEHDFITNLQRLRELREKLAGQANTVVRMVESVRDEQSCESAALTDDFYHKKVEELITHAEGVSVDILTVTDVVSTLYQWVNTLLAHPKDTDATRAEYISTVIKWLASIPPHLAEVLRFYVMWYYQARKICQLGGARAQYNDVFHALVTLVMAVKEDILRIDNTMHVIRMHSEDFVPTGRGANGGSYM